MEWIILIVLFMFALFSIKIRYTLIKAPIIVLFLIIGIIIIHILEAFV